MSTNRSAGGAYARSRTRGAYLDSMVSVQHTAQVCFLYRVYFVG